MMVNKKSDTNFMKIESNKIKHLKDIFLTTSLLCYCFLTKIEAQNFNYALIRDSTSYAELSTPTILSSNESWSNKQFKIGLPFQFNLCGNLSDSVFIESNGFIVFNKNTQLSIVAFNEFTSKKDTNQTFSAALGYRVEGGSANRIIKIQFSNLSKSMLSDSDHLNYQVWLYENGNKIEFHIGPNSYVLDEESSSQQLLGVINRSMDSNPTAFLVNGSSYSPTGQSVNANENLIYLNNIPSEGAVFRLTPTF